LPFGLIYNSPVPPLRAAKNFRDNGDNVLDNGANVRDNGANVKNLILADSLNIGGLSQQALSTKSPHSKTYVHYHVH
jgi:hypothetical protein